VAGQCQLIGCQGIKPAHGGDRGCKIVRETIDCNQSKLDSDAVCCSGAL